MTLNPHGFTALADLPAMDDPQLVLFYRQYMQQIPNPTFPPAQLLLHDDIQQQIYKYFFDGPLKGPPDHQRRILKRLIELIERAIPVDNVDELEVTSVLMEHIAYLSTIPASDPVTSASQTQIITYTTPCPFEAAPQRIMIEEAPNLLAAGSNVGLRTWEASLHLATYLYTHPPVSKTVLELGAGTGLVSILCAMLGSQFVMSTDGLPHVVDAMEKNFFRNRKMLGDRSSCLVPKILDWNEPKPGLEDVLETGGEMPAYDLIVGADITYSPDVVPVLAEMLNVLMNEMFIENRMEALISATVRNEHTLNVFQEACKERNLVVEQVEFTCPSVMEQKGFFHEQAFPIIIMNIKSTKQDF